MKRMTTKGFTLVEVMVALGLLLMIGVSIARTMQLSFETKEKVTIVNDRYHEGRQVVTRNRAAPARMRSFNRRIRIPERSSSLVQSSGPRAKLRATPP